MRGGPAFPGVANGNESILSQSAQPLAIVVAVVVLGASLYLWRKRYIRSRAAWITILAIVGVLFYVGFFSGNPPT